MAVPIFEANNYGCGILWVCFLMSMRSVYRISRCNFIADWTIVLWKISIAGLTLATSQLATTDNLLEHLHHPGPDFIFPKQSIGGKMSLRDFSNTLGFQSGLFFTTIRLRSQFSPHLLENV